MRLRRIEFIVIALTVAFACFMGGYFAGSRGSVNIVSVEPQYGEAQQVTAAPPASEAGRTAPPASAPETGAASAGAAAADAASAGAAADSSGSPAGSGESPAEAVQPAAEPAGAPRGGDGRININTASRSELTDLPGIGDVLSGRIVDYRNQHGAFASIEDIRNVSGIGEKRFEAIRDKITVG